MGRKKRHVGLNRLLLFRPKNTATVSLRGSLDGSVCGASAASDRVAKLTITRCSISHFRGSSFPRPTAGRVTVNVTIRFKVK